MTPRLFEKSTAVMAAAAEVEPEATTADTVVGAAGAAAEEEDDAPAVAVAAACCCLRVCSTNSCQSCTSCVFFTAWLKDSSEERSVARIFWAQLSASTPKVFFSSV